MTITIFGKAIGGSSGSPTNGKGTGSGMQRPTLLGKNSTATRTATSSTPASQKTGQTGRAGYQGPTSTNAGSAVTVVQTGALSAGAQITQPISDDGDYVGMVVTETVVSASQTGATDILGALGTWTFIGPDGAIITMQPNPDFYLFSQRLSEFGTICGTTSTSVTTVSQTVTGSYYVPINLPQSGGPYTLIIVLASTLGSGALTSVATTVSLKLGTAPNRTRYQYTSFPFTPGNNGSNDFSPVAPIQDQAMDEIFLTGLTATAGLAGYQAAISFIQVQSLGSTVATNEYVAALVGKQAASLTTAVPTGYLYPCLALNTQITLGRSGHFWFYWGATAPTTARIGLLWHD
jgi:hypothetical protein